MGLSGEAPPFLLNVFEGTERAEVRLEKKMMELEEYTLNMPTWSEDEFRLFNDTYGFKNRYLYRIPCTYFPRSAHIRFSHIIDEHNRVKLIHNASGLGSDYINASLLEYGNARYIATQAPIKSTFCDFWNMIWDQDVRMIVMLVAIQKRRCEQYWDEQTTLTFGAVRVRLIEEAVISGKDIIHRTFLLSRGGCNRIISQVHYTTWPDHGVPRDFSTVAKVLETVGESPNYHCPLLVHCSAGIGRTGTFCVLNTILKHANIRKGEQEDLVLEVTKRFRSQRHGTVENLEQFRFIYEFLYYHILEAAKNP